MQLEINYINVNRVHNKWRVRKLRRIIRFLPNMTDVYRRGKTINQIFLLKKKVSCQAKSAKQRIA